MPPLLTMDQNSWNQYGRSVNNQSSAFTGTLDHSALAATGMTALSALPSGPRVATVNPYSHTVPSTVQQSINVEHVQPAVQTVQYRTTSELSPSKVVGYSPLSQGHEIVVSTAPMQDTQTWSLTNFLQQRPQVPKHTFLTMNESHQLNLTTAQPAQNLCPSQSMATLSIPPQQHYKPVVTPSQVLNDSLQTQLQQHLMTKQSYAEPNQFESVSPNNSQSYTGTLGLQDLADISSSQEKIPVLSHNRSNILSVMQDTSISAEGNIIVSSNAVDLPLQVLSNSPLKKPQPMQQLHEDVHSAVVSMDSIISMVDVQGASSTYTLPLNSISSAGHVVQLVEQKQTSEAHDFLPSSEAFVNPNEMMHTTECTDPLVNTEDDPVTKKPSYDEEFAHLSAPKPPPPSAPALPAFPKTESGFQGSFLSFLQGQKPETLSSVTSSISAPYRKPQLPKYIPFVHPTTSETSEGKNPSSDPSCPVKKAPTVVVKKVEKPSTSAVVVKASALGSHVKLNTHVTNVVSKNDDGYCNIIITGGSTKKGTTQKSTAAKQTKKKAIPKPKKKPEVVAKETTEVVARETSKRKAKEQAEKRRKQKKSRQGDDFVGFSSCSEEEFEYDSDKDPGWDPTGGGDQPMRRNSSGSEDEEKKIRMPLLVKKKMTPVTVTPVSQKSFQNIAPKKNTIGVKVVPPTDFPNDYDEPHNFFKGTYVIDRRDLTNHEHFPVWRIEGGRLLRKYEAFVENGELLHRALSTYSSYTDHIRRTYKAIEVDIRCHQAQKEVLSVVQRYRPRAPDDSLEGDERMPVFNVYLQTLISQALEPGFLSAICKENGDEYYMSPLRSIEDDLRKIQEMILERISWTENFKSSLERFPNFSMVKILKCSTDCEVTTNIVAPACYELTLEGVPYDSTSLVSSTVSHLPCKFLIGDFSSKLAKSYHQLHHFKSSLYKCCELQVRFLKMKNNNSDNSALLDEILQDRAWAQMHFRNLREILNQELPTCEVS